MLRASYGTNLQGKSHHSTQEIENTYITIYQYMRLRSQQAREVTDPKRQHISNCIIGTSHILLLQKQKKMKDALMRGKDPRRGAHTVYHVTHKL